jgi:hypothetical protein
MRRCGRSLPEDRWSPGAGPAGLAGKPADDIYRERPSALSLSCMEGTGMRPAELRLAAAVKAGEECDLSAYPERERAVRASVLREILLTRVGVGQSPGGVRLRGAVIDGDLDLSDVPEAVTVDLTGCQVSRICLHGANPPPIAGKRDAKGPGPLRVVSSLPDRIGMWQFIIVLAFVFVVVKVIWIARGDIPTALGVFNSAGPATVIAGGLLSALPLISAIALGLAVFEIIRSWLLPDRARLQPAGRRGGVRRAFGKFPRDPFVWTVFIIAAVACFLLTPWLVMASGAFLGLVPGILAWAASKAGRPVNNRRRWIRAIGGGVIWAAVGILFFMLVLNPLLYAVWLPHEMLTVASPGQQQQSAVGYVLSDSNGWVSLLRTRERRIYRYRSEDVKARALCRAKSISWPYAPPGFNKPNSLWNTIFPSENKKPLSC